MGVLLIIRHGQASSLDYGGDGDRLSPLGFEQARKLGERWTNEGRTPTHVFVGPRRRHRETHQAVASVYRERKLPFPDPEFTDALDEYPAPAILSRGAAAALERDPALAQIANAFAEHRDTSSGDFIRFFQAVTAMWVRGELAEALEGVETWLEFRARVAAGLRSMIEAGGRGATVAAFTSGGAVAAAAGHALDLSDQRVLELSWLVRNTSITEIVFSAQRVALAAFNGVPHLVESRTLTVR